MFRARFWGKQTALRPVGIAKCETAGSVCHARRIKTRCKSSRIVLASYEPHPVTTTLCCASQVNAWYSYGSLNGCTATLGIDLLPRFFEAARIAYKPRTVLLEPYYARTLQYKNAAAPQHRLGQRQNGRPPRSGSCQQGSGPQGGDFRHRWSCFRHRMPDSGSRLTHPPMLQPGRQRRRRPAR